MHQEIADLMGKMAELNRRHREEFHKIDGTLRNKIYKKTLAIDTQLAIAFQAAYPNAQDFLDECYAPLRALSDEYNLPRRKELTIADMNGPNLDYLALGETYARLYRATQHAYEDLGTLRDITRNYSLRERPQDTIENIPTATFVRAIADHLVPIAAPVPDTMRNKSLLRSGIEAVFGKKHQPEVSGTWLGKVQSVDTRVLVDDRSGTKYPVCLMTLDVDGQAMRGVYVLPSATIFQKDRAYYPEIGDLVTAKNLGRQYENSELLGWDKGVRVFGVVDQVLPSSAMSNDRIEMTRVEEIGKAVLHGDSPFRHYIVKDPKGNRAVRVIDGARQPRAMSLAGEARPHFGVGDMLLNGEPISGNLEELVGKFFGDRSGKQVLGL